MLDTNRVTCYSVLDGVVFEQGSLHDWEFEPLRFVGDETNQKLILRDTTNCRFARYRIIEVPDANGELPFFCCDDSNSFTFDYETSKANFSVEPLSKKGSTSFVLNENTINRQTLLVVSEFV